MNRKIVLKGKKIVGAFLVNDIEDADIIRHLVFRKSDVSALLKNPSLGDSF